MRYGKFLLSGIILLLLFCNTQGQDIDSKQSIVRFSIDNMKWNTVEGTFTGMNGTVEFNPNDLSKASLNVCVDAASVNTGSEKRDKHLRNEDFFEVERFPKICFVSQSITREKDQYSATGQLTLHGVTRKITIPFEFRNQRFTASLTINRQDFQLGGSGTFMVGAMVELEIGCLLR